MHLTLASASYAEDSGYLAMQDLAGLAQRLDIDYRLVGGHMVSLLVAASGVAGVPGRDTGDADFGVPSAVARDPRLLSELQRMGYSQTSGNRCERPAGELTLTIDVLAPSYTGRIETNRAHGDLVLDEIPGLNFALTEPGLHLALTVRLTSGSQLDAEITVPSYLSALCLKALAFASRSAGKDAFDVWRLLEAAHTVGLSGEQWPDSVTPNTAVATLRRDFGRAGGHGLAARPERAQVRTRVRALVAAACGP